MTTTAERILAHAEILPEGHAFSAKELLHLGQRPAIDQALSRLVRRGRLLRIGRGLYTHPVRSRFGARAPAPEAVIESLAERTGETITPSGAVSANRLGLTTQNPTKAVYMTSGPSRTLTIGKQQVELRHAPAWQLRASTSRAGEALRALAWLGPKKAKGKARILGRKLTSAERSELAALRAQTPTWLAQELSVLAVDG